MIQKLRKKIIEGNHMKSVRLEDAQEHVCLNCGTTFRGKHCPECRQKASTKRLDMMATVKNITSKYITLDSGLLHTVVDLLYRPGYMVRDYIQGYRIEYVEPLMLMILLLAFKFVMPSAFPEKVIAPFPEELATRLTPYPVSLALAKAWYWVFSDMQRTMIMFAFMFGMATNLTLKIIRAGKEHMLNVSESVHLFLYWICFKLIVAIFVDFIFWTLPADWADKELAEDICDIPCYVVFLIMIRDCTRIGWKKLILFVPGYIFSSLLYIVLLAVFVFVVINLDLPEDIAEDMAYDVVSTVIPK